MKIPVSPMSLTIYHNPKCSKSRRTLELIRARGIEPTIVLYLEAPPSAERILELAGLLACPVRDLLRSSEEEFREAADLPELDDAAAVASWLTRHPRVLQRPIVVDDERPAAVVGRPPEAVLGLLP